MVQLTRNIWTIYFIFLLVSIVLAGVISSHRWQGVVNEYKQQHIHRAEQVASAIHAVFVSQEMLLDVLGQQLLREHRDLTSPQSPQILDDLLVVNPWVSGFGLARPDGELVLVNSAQDKSLLPNLATQDSSRDSFRDTLLSHNMVVGRTYYIKAMGEWSIPIRKALRDSEGNVLAVMTAGIRVRGASKIFEKDLHYGTTDEVNLIRGSDFYLQYHSSSAKNLDVIYQQPLSDTILDNGFSALMAAANTDFAGIRQLPGAMAYKVERDGRQRIEATLYDNRYDLWVSSSVDFNDVVMELIPKLMTYAAIFLILQLIILALFRSIAAADKKTRNHLEYQAAHDVLTALPNRYFLVNRTSHLIDIGVERFSLLFIDIDNFKGINDNFGHDVGDQVLQDVARRLGREIGQSELVARLGGDEFVVITTRSDEQELKACAGNIINSLGQVFSVRNMQFHLGASIGIARYPQHGDSLNALLRAADIAMYEAKKDKNSVVIHRDEIEDTYLRHNRIEQLLRLAYHRNELFMVYQPQMNRAGSLVGVEALVRWNNAELGFIPPDQFIAVAETSGLMTELGNFIIERSLRDIRQVQDVLSSRFNLSLNISVRQLLQPGFVQMLAELIQRYRFSPHEIVLEITENLFIEDMNNIGSVIFALRDHGFNLSLDDFGTGYSSLSVLQKLPIDELKVDKSFVDDIHHDEKARQMIKNIIAIGKNYGMSVLAEGVETEQQVRMLNTLGCDHYQGYWFSRPLDVEGLRHFVESAAGNVAADTVCDDLPGQA